MPIYFQNLVRGAIFTQRQAGVRSADLDIFIRVGDGLPELIVYPTRRKVGEGAGVWNFPGGSRTCGDAHHIGFCNSDLKKTFRERFDEGFHFQRPDEVGARSDHFRILFSNFKQPCTKAVSRVAFFPVLMS